MIASRVFVAAVVLIASASTAAQMPVAAVADLVAATEACRGAMEAGEVDEAKLIADGWTAAQWSENGKPSAGPVRVFNKAGVKAAVMLPQNGPVCMGISRIPDVATFNATAVALDQSLAAPRKRQPDEQNAALWFSQSQLVQLQLTGKLDSPGARISVMSMSQEKK